MTLLVNREVTLEVTLPVDHEVTLEVTLRNTNLHQLGKINENKALHIIIGEVRLHLLPTRKVI